MKPATVAALIPVTRCMLEARGEELTEESVYRIVRTLRAQTPELWYAISLVAGCKYPSDEIIEQVALQLAAEYLIEEDRHTIPDMPVLLPSGVWH